jgi:hypothetical protein
MMQSEGKEIEIHGSYIYHTDKLWYIPTMKRFFCIFFFLIAIMSPSFSDGRLGAELAVPKVNEYLSSLHLKTSQMHTFSDDEAKQFIALAAKLKINIFELIDCTFRYVSTRNIRVSISGISLRKLQNQYDFGGERVLAIIPIDKLQYIETGAFLSGDQKDLDIYLTSVHQSYIEIGTAEYEPRFGFEAMLPLVYSQAYGITVKKLFFSAPLEKLELYAPGKGAIYAKGLSRPKRWNLDIITEKNK